MLVKKTVLLPIDQVHPNPNQPRKYFDQEELQKLADNIALHGQTTPILVRPIDDDHYEIVHGERRARACKMAGLSTVRAEIGKDIDDKTAYVLSMVENLQRVDISPVEAAQGIKTMMDADSLTQVSVAEKLSKSRGWVAQKLQMLTLPQGVQDYIHKGRLNETHGKQLCRLRNAEMGDKIESVAQEAAEKGWTVNELTTRVNLVITKTEIPETPPVDLLPEELVRAAFKLGVMAAFGNVLRNTSNVSAQKQGVA